MKKKIVALLLASVMFFQLTNYAKAKEPEIIPMSTTAYYEGEITASGTKPRKGICAVNKERLGLTAIVYLDENGELGEILGYYECLDTGFGSDPDGDGIGSIEEGKCIDIYFPTPEDCKEWMKLTGGKCHVQFIYAEG
ncbi:MAG: hypothetical protein J6B68_01680 [Lachnospiraceae bacterium]|nr:hypothetical protein [Lachnospiraceae bacterium]MBP3477557.1 hypothetical protein [Lachnospiraceae bacterium]